MQAVSFKWTECRTYKELIMVRNILILVVVLVSRTAFAESLAFEIAPWGNNWSVLAHADGIVSISGQSIDMHINKLIIEVPDAQESPVKIVKYSFGVSQFENRRNGPWRVITESNMQAVNYVMQSGEAIQIDNVDAAIPLRGIDDVRKGWLTLTIIVEINGNSFKTSNGYLYAHSDMHIFE
jgi:hypothetical protein